MVDSQARRPIPLAFLASILLAMLGTPLVAPATASAGLCMLPAQLPFEKDDPRRAALERIVARVFEAQSIEVAPSAEVQVELDGADEAAGEIFDPATGRVDEAKEAAYLDELERRLRATLGCGGLIELSLHQVIARYDGTNALWDGQRAKVNSNARIAGRIALSILAGAYITESGWVPALSLWVRITDLRRRDVAFRSAGVEPLVDFSYSRSQDLLPVDRWLRDEAIVEAAVASALGSDLSLLKADTLPADSPGVAGFRWE